MSFFKCCGSSGKQLYEVQKYQDGHFKTETVKDIKKLRQANANEAVVRVKKSEYDDLKKIYVKDKKFTDETFPPNSKSLGVIQNVPQDCEWKRISQIASNPKLFVQGIQPTDVVQGSLGDCYFLSALASLAEEDQRIHNVFGNQEYNPNGLYKITMRIDGIIQQIVIDDYVPVNKANKPLFCQPNKNQFWVVLLEKAWAKAHGSYANIASGTPTEVFKAVTYAPSELKPIKQDEQSQNLLWNQIIQYARKNSPCCAGTRNEEGVQYDSVGLTPGHAYTLLNAAELVDQQGEVKRMIKLRNPWGHNQWNGQGSQNDHGFWSRIQDNQEKSNFLHEQAKGNDGVFYMKYQDFCHYFNEVHFCHLLSAPKYQIQKLHCNQKNDQIFSFKIQKTDDYFIEVHQSGMRGQDPEKVQEGANRSTLFLAKGDTYEFIDGSLKYQQQDNALMAHLDPGEYFIYANIEPTYNKKLMPQNMSLSCYSNSFVDLVAADKKKKHDFFQKVFLEYGRNHKRKEYNDGKMWISWKLLYEKGGFAYLAFGVHQSSDKKFVINFEEKDFQEANYILNEPHRGKGKQTFDVKPGKQQVIIAKVKNGPIQSMKFPPPFDIQIDRA